MKPPSDQQLPWSRLPLRLKLLLVVMMVRVEGESSLLHQPDWGVWTYLEEDVTLRCDHSHLAFQPDNFVRWELPSGEAVVKSSDKYRLTSDDQGKVTNMNLTVRNVHDTDSGVYVCHVYSTFAMQAKTGQGVRGLNIGGHLYREPFDRYRRGVLLGGCLAAGLLFIMLAGCLIYKFRYRTATLPKQRQQEHGYQESRQRVSGVPQSYRGNGQRRELDLAVITEL